MEIHAETKSHFVEFILIVLKLCPSAFYHKGKYFKTHTNLRELIKQEYKKNLSNFERKSLTVFVLKLMKYQYKRVPKNKQERKW